MSQEQLIDKHLRLQRKLSMSCRTWNSGRIDQLADALRSVERQLRDRQLQPPASAVLVSAGQRPS